MVPKRNLELGTSRELLLCGGARTTGTSAASQFFSRRGVHLMPQKLRVQPSVGEAAADSLTVVWSGGLTADAMKDMVHAR